LFEEFTGENCGPCAGINPYMKRFSELNAQDSFIHLAYQSPIPSAGPIYNIYKTETDARMTYYGVNFAPWGENDGGLFPIWPSGVGSGNDNLVTFYFDSASIATQTPQNPTSPGFTARRAVLSPCAITITHRYSTNYDSIYAMAIVANTSTYTSSSLKFRLALTEKQLTYSSPPGTNGEVEFYNVVRKMYPSAAGTAMAATQTAGTFDTFYVAAKIPSYVRDRGQLQFIGWVQDDATKEVKQSGSSALQPVTNLVDILADGDSVPGIVCNNSGSSPIFSFVNVKNTGGATITTMSVKVIVDAAVNSTVPWTGSLAPGATTQINVGPVTVTSGTHAISFVVTNPNGVPTFSAVYDTAKDVTYLSGTSVAPPYQQAFEVTTSFPPANCYSEAEVAGDYPFYPSSAFGTTGNTYWGAEGTTHSLVLLSFYNADGDASNFYLPKMNFTGIANARFTFWHAYRQFNFGNGLSNEQLDLQASTDCGATWTSVWSKAGNALATVAAPTTAGTNSTPSYKPTAASDWVQDVVSFNGLFNNHDDVWLRFHGISNYGDNVWVDQINIENATGIHSLDDANLVSVYPNPANDNMSLQLGVSQTAGFEVTVLNTLGQTVNNVFSGDLAEGAHNFDINVAGLPAGVYNIEIKSNDQKTVKRFVVSH
jgi:hypothetical protein